MLRYGKKKSYYLTRLSSIETQIIINETVFNLSFIVGNVMQNILFQIQS